MFAIERVQSMRFYTLLSLHVRHFLSMQQTDDIVADAHRAILTSSQIPFLSFIAHFQF